MKELNAKIQATLLNNSQKSVIGWAVEEGDFETVAQEIGKLCAIHFVSQQRELLFDFVDKMTKDRTLNCGDVDRWYVEKYLSNNCG